MDSQRRSELASAARSALPRVQRAVTDSWAELLPAAEFWSQASTRRARAASRAALEGLVGVIAQGDLDDRTWDRVRHLAHGRGHATPEEVADLLRTIRLVGVEVIARELEQRAGLTQSERWRIQQDASIYCDRLVLSDEEIDPEAYRDLLSALEEAGPDLG